MVAGLLRAELHLPGAASLKDKRGPLKSLAGRLRARFHVSVAEIDHQDKHQRAALCIAVAAADGPALARQLEAVKEFILNNPEFAVLDLQCLTVDGPEGFAGSGGRLQQER